MLYQGQEIKVLVVYPRVAKAIQEDRQRRGLPSVPIEELDYGQEEASEIANLLDAKLLSGRKATIHGLLDELADGYDIVWLVTHALPQGWYLNDGIVNVSETTQLIRAAGTFLTVMNTCSSYEVAQQAALELGTAFICTLQEVPDRQAFITGVLYAQKLAAGLDYASAFYAARPGNDSNYKLIEARDEMPPTGRARSYSTNQPAGAVPDHETFQKFFKAVSDLDLIVRGNREFDLPPLKELIRGLEVQVTTIKSELSQVNLLLTNLQKEKADRDRITNWIMLGMAIIILGLVATVVILANRGVT